MGAENYEIIRKMMICGKKKKKKLKWTWFTVRLDKMCSMFLIYKQKAVSLTVKDAC